MGHAFLLTVVNYSTFGRGKQELLGTVPWRGVSDLQDGDSPFLLHGEKCPLLLSVFFDHAEEVGGVGF